MQDQFTELQFQCDRRASEIDSIVFRMYDLTQQDAVKRGIQDPKITTLLDATFNELMPREAIMMHVTRTRVDKSLLDAMEKVLDDAAARIDNAKNASAMRARETFLKEVKASLYPEDAPGGDKVVQENTSNYPVIHEFKLARNGSLVVPVPAKFGYRGLESNVDCMALAQICVTQI